jgi:anti-anti-sigma factor
MEPSPGTIERSQDGAAWVLALRGEHDLSTAPALQREIDEIYDSGSTVVVDLTHVEFVDSSILNVLVHGCERASKRAEHQFALVAPANSIATRILDLVIGHRVPRFETPDAAIAALSQPRPG